MRTGATSEKQKWAVVVLRGLIRTGSPQGLTLTLARCRLPQMAENNELGDHLDEPRGMLFEHAVTAQGMLFEHAATAGMRPYRGGLATDNPKFCGAWERTKKALQRAKQ